MDASKHTGTIMVLAVVGLLALGAVLDTDRPGPPTATAVASPADLERAKAEKRAARQAEDARQREKAEQAALVDLNVSCRGRVRAAAKHPSKVDFYWLSYVQGRAPNNPELFYVAGKVDLMNGFGAMIPHIYACTLDPRSGAVDFYMDEEGG